MVEAILKHWDDSVGMSSRAISFPSRRSVSSLEKLVTFIKLQKLPRVNSGTKKKKNKLNGYFREMLYYIYIAS